MYISFAFGLIANAKQRKGLVEYRLKLSYSDFRNTDRVFNHPYEAHMKAHEILRLILKTLWKWRY